MLNNITHKWRIFLVENLDIFNFKTDPRFSEGIVKITSQLAFIFTADSVFPTPWGSGSPSSPPTKPQPRPPTSLIE